MKLESLDLTRIKLDDNLHLSGTSARKQAARKRMAAATNFKALKPEHVSKFLENRLKRLYERVKINGALTNDKIFKYLSLFTSAAIPVLGDFPRKNQKTVIKKFATSTRSGTSCHPNFKENSRRSSGKSEGMFNNNCRNFKKPKRCKSGK